MSAHPPRMDVLLGSGEARRLEAEFGRASLKAALRDAMAENIRRWRQGGEAPAPAELLISAERLLRARFDPPLRRVINATGVVLHTNLGRAPLPSRALRRASELLSGYVDLETDLSAHGRGHRDARLESAIQDLLQTDRGVVAVNNNAAAVLLMLNTLSAGRETLVSRGELVEIGGGFRIPEVMAASGARLREVGTTNRTRIADFRSAIGPASALLLNVHPSNFRILGFTERASLEELVSLGREVHLPVGCDLGSGLLAPAGELGLRDEPTVEEALSSGADAICFSTDKLFGACQGGLLLVEPSRLQAFRTNPLLRALRVDKVTYLLMGAAVEAYRKGRWQELPALGLLATPRGVLLRRAGRLKAALDHLAPDRFESCVVEAEGRAGGGTAPLDPLPSPALALKPSRGKAHDLEAYLRAGGEPPVVGVLAEGTLLLHVRTLLPGDIPALLDRLARFQGSARESDPASQTPMSANQLMPT